MLLFLTTKMAAVKKRANQEIFQQRQKRDEEYRVDLFAIYVYASWFFCCFLS